MASVIEKVAKEASGERLQRAVSGLVSGAYQVKVTRLSEGEIRGFVANGDGKEYGVVLTPEMTTCSCPDSMYRHQVCKHQVILALYVVRPLKERPQEGEHRPHLKLAKVRSSEELYG